MATLREQARAAARSETLWKSHLVGTDSVADAASDVWEPVVEQLVSTLRETQRRLRRMKRSTCEIEGVLKEFSNVG